MSSRLVCCKFSVHAPSGQASTIYGAATRSDFRGAPQVKERRPLAVIVIIREVDSNAGAVGYGGMVSAWLAFEFSDDYPRPIGKMPVCTMYIRTYTVTRICHV